MSRYSDIAALASQRSAEFWDERNRARGAAIQLAEVVKKDLEIPEDKVSFVELNPQDLESTQNVKQSSTWPEMTFGLDSHWYFGLRIRFEVPGNTAYEDLTLKIGIKPLAKGVTIRFEQDYFAETPEDLGRFTDWLYRDLMEHYAKPRSQRPRRLGFID